MAGKRILAAVLTVGVAAALGGCTADRGRVEISNDLDRTVEVLQCGDNLCMGDFHIHGELEPGASFPANVSSRGVPNPWLVRELDGERLGCLPLVMPRPTEGLVAYVSDAVPCKRKYDESQLWPPR